MIENAGKYKNMERGKRFSSFRKKMRKEGQNFFYETFICINEIYKKLMLVDQEHITIYLFLGN